MSYLRPSTNWAFASPFSARRITLSFSEDGEEQAITANTVAARILLAATVLAVMACSSPSSEKDNVIRRAEKGDANAQFVLGRKYDIGKGVPQDYAEAAKWYRMAAEQGHAEAQFNLGMLYDEGRGVSQDYAEAAKWYRKAKDQGI